MELLVRGHFEVNLVGLPCPDFQVVDPGRQDIGLTSISGVDSSTKLVTTTTNVAGIDSKLRMIRAEELHMGVSTIGSQEQRFKLGGGGDFKLVEVSWSIG